jgi:hypothetical protein
MQEEVVHFHLGAQALAALSFHSGSKSRGIYSCGRDMQHTTNLRLYRTLEGDYQKPEEVRQVHALVLALQLPKDADRCIFGKFFETENSDVRKRDNSNHLVSCPFRKLHKRELLQQRLPRQQWPV